MARLRWWQRSTAISSPSADTTAWETSDAGEVAFVVQDGYQRHGIGRELLTLLAGIGWADGIRRFVADTFAENHAMLDVFRHTPGAVTVIETRAMAVSSI